MFMTTHSVLVDAHFTSSGLSSLVSVSSLFPCNIVGCLPMQTLHILLLVQSFALCSLEILLRHP